MSVFSGFRTLRLLCRLFPAPAVRRPVFGNVVKQFGNMRAAFLDAIKDADTKTLQTGIVVKLASMCKEYSKLLTDNEKKTCMNSINEMKDTLKKVNADTFMDGMLQEAWIALSK